MALTQRLQIRQSQALVMTPQLMQAIKLLQLSNLDLAAYVEAELERNPLLERGAENEPTASSATDGVAPDSPTADAEAPAGGGAANGPTDNDSREESLEDASLDEAAPLRSRLADMPAGYSEWAGAASGSRDGGEYDLEAFVSAERTLAELIRE